MYLAGFTGWRGRRAWGMLGRIMASQLAWGVLSTGRIAETFVRGANRSKTGRVVAVASRNPARAEAFAAQKGVPVAHGSYEALLSDPRVTAVYVATPHPFHVEWVIRAANAGKHVLCEKPLGMSRDEAMRAIEACRKAGVMLMEAYMYRCHPQTRRVVEIVKSGALGRVCSIQAAFSFHLKYQAESRAWAKSLGGGGILDVGGYPVSFARLIAGAACGVPFVEPVTFSGAAVVHPESGVDAYAAALLTFPGNILAEVSCGIGLQRDNAAWIYGSEGWLQIPVPWIPNREGGRSRILLQKRGVPEPEEIVVETDEFLYGMEADAFARALGCGMREVPEVTTEDTLGTMAVLDQWRAAAGVEYG